MQIKPLGKKGNTVLIIMAVIVLIVLAGLSLASNANSVVNWFYDDVQSGTPRAKGCEPEKYLIEFTGTLDLMNQKQETWTLDYKIDYLDAHITDIRISPTGLGFFTNEFKSKVCLYDVLKGGDNWIEEQVDCLNINDYVTKGQIEKFPFEFRYNLYDNDCNGEVDDHTFNLVVTLETDEGKETFEKTVAITNGEAVFQNTFEDY